MTHKTNDWKPGRVHIDGRTYSKDEWRDVAIKARPGLSDNEFDIMWSEFVADQNRRTLQ